MIRAARLEDLEGLVEVSWQVQQQHRTANPARYRDTPREEIAARCCELLADDDQTILVAEVDGDVRGYAVVRRVDSPGNTYALPRVSAHVDALGVRDDARRAGVGRALMAAVEAQSRSWGADGVTLDVQAFNADAATFYEALGYAVTTYRMSKPTSYSGAL